MTAQTTASPDAAAQKAALRRDALDARAAIPSDLRARAGEAIVDIGAEIVAHAGPRRVSLFFSVKGEIDVLPLARRLAEAGVALALPVILAKGEPLLFRDWRPGDALDDRPFGLKEPPPSAAEVEPDLLFVPLAAFDGAGRRLGYGGGFYDRTLAMLRARRPTVAVGLAFAAQEVARVPVSAWDEPLDGVLTEAGYLALAPAAA